MAKEVKCWGCNGPHLYRNCPHNPNRKMAPINMLREASTVNDIARNIPRKNIDLDYIAPRVLEKCKLSKEKQKNA